MLERLLGGSGSDTDGESGGLGQLLSLLGGQETVKPLFMRGHLIGMVETRRGTPSLGVVVMRVLGPSESCPRARLTLETQGEIEFEPEDLKELLTALPEILEKALPVLEEAKATAGEAFPTRALGSLLDTV